MIADELCRGGLVDQIPTVAACVQERIAGLHVDALAVGISFSAVGINIAFSCTLIMAVTFICCMLGVFIGMKFGDILSEKAQLAGGAVLIAIGIKTLVF